jgi:hypothetical protein
MIVDIEFQCRQDFTSKTGAVSKNVAPSRFLIDVPEASADDAPVVILIGEKGSEQERSTIRVHDGLLYEAWKDEQEGPDHDRTRDSPSPSA